MEGKHYNDFEFCLDADGGFGWASFKNASHGVVLGLGDPEAIFVLDGNLASDVLTAEAFVFREPCGGVTIGFALVSLGIDR